MAGGRLASLRIERNQLVEQWLNKKDSNNAKLLVQIMDLDEAIDREQELLRKNNLKQKFNY